MCGIGVTSLMDLTCSPAVASACIADSRPLPGPWTRTCTRRTPSVMASRATCSAATVAAKGVDFFDPLNPALPAEPHATAFPRLSVIVTVVLLNVALTWAMPSASITRFVFFAVAIPESEERRTTDGLEAAPTNYLVTFFLPAIARRGPFFVRALVCVRWPRTGSPRRCRMPRYEPMSIRRLMFIAVSVRSAPSTR